MVKIIASIRRIIQISFRNSQFVRRRSLQTRYLTQNSWSFGLLAFIVYCYDNSSNKRKENRVIKTPKMLDDLILQSDQLFAEAKYKESFEVLLDLPDQDKNVEILWRISRGIFEFSLIMNNTKEKADLIRKGFELIKRALELDDTHGAVHIWYAALLDANSDQNGIWERLNHLQNVKYHLIRATECNPDDPMAWFTLGRFEFGIADMSWYLMKLMQRLVNDPPTGCYMKALECFHRAEKLYPMINIMNHLWLGKVYTVLKDVEKAKHHLMLASTGAVTNETEKKYQIEADDLLKKL